jgi:hypothetical protein
MRVRIILTMAVGLVAFAGCGANDQPEKGQASAIRGGTVPVVLKGTDDTVVVKKTASVTDEDYKLDSSTASELGDVTIRAKTATTTAPVEDQHFFSGHVVYNSGTKVKCNEARGHTWSDYGVFEDIEMRCDDFVVLSEVKAFELDLS